MTESGSAYRGRTKYDEATARRYQVRRPSKHHAELNLVTRAFALIPKTHRVLDVPCGGGRVTAHLSSLGYAVTAADLSESMLAIARTNLQQEGWSCPVEQQDLEKLTYGDGHFDTVICFRLFHHFPTPEIRQRVIAELCRVAGRNVVLSYFSPWSVTSVRRELRKAYGGKTSEKHSTSLAEVKGYFQRMGYEFIRDFAQFRLVHTLHVAVFGRRSEVKP